MSLKGEISIILDTLSNASAINFPEIIIANGLGAAMMLVILLNRQKGRKFVSSDGKLFLRMCRLSLVLCLLEIFGFWVDGKAFWSARHLNRIVNAILFASNAVFACLWICYIQCKIFEDLHRPKKIHPLVTIPAIVICIMCGANLFSDVFFGVTSDNYYYRLPLCSLTYVVSYIYMISGAMLVFVYRKNLEKNIFRTVVVYLIPIFVGGVVQYFYYGLSLIWPSTAVGLTILYINLQHELFYLDPLTQLYNRSYFFDYIEQFQCKKDKGKSLRLFGVMLDVNNFKYINDQYGHLEGDRALRKVGNILRDAVGKDGVVVRYGGDEFIILVEKALTDAVFTDLRQRINFTLNEYNATNSLPYPLSLAMGAAQLDGSDVDAFFQEMDGNMYLDKLKHYDGLKDKSETIQTAPNCQFALHKIERRPIER